MYNQSVVQSSNLWTANSTGGDVDFCIKLSLYSNSSNGILFNFVETIYKVQVDLTSGFSTNVDVVRTAANDGGAEIIDVEEDILAYQCDDAFEEVTSPPQLTQGDSLQICVETNGTSVYEVGKIKDVVVSQNGTKSFDYVTSFEDSYWASSLCTSINTTASKCKVKMQLLGDYFTDTDPSDLIVSGFVKMDYVGRRLVGDTVNSISGDWNKQRSLFDRNDLTESEGSSFTVGVSLSGLSENDSGERGEFTDENVGSVHVTEAESGSYIGMMMHSSIISGLLTVAVTTYVMSMKSGGTRTA